jgi:hypothetical protein
MSDAGADEYEEVENLDEVSGNRVSLWSWHVTMSAFCCTGLTLRAGM